MSDTLAERLRELFLDRACSVYPNGHGVSVFVCIEPLPSNYTLTAKRARIGVYLSRHRSEPRYMRRDPHGYVDCEPTDLHRQLVNAILLLA